MLPAQFHDDDSSMYKLDTEYSKRLKLLNKDIKYDHGKN